MAKPIPDGYHTITPHIVCKDADKAIEFYMQAFGAIERGRMPGPDGEKIMHAEVQIGNSILMLVDEYPEMKCLGPTTLKGSPVTLHLYVDDVDAVFKRAIAAGGKETMPVMDMFWGDRYGQLTDPFGHSWSIATHKKDYTPEEMEKGAKEAFAHMCSES